MQKTTKKEIDVHFIIKFETLASHFTGHILQSHYDTDHIFSFTNQQTGSNIDIQINDIAAYDKLKKNQDVTNNLAALLFVLVMNHKHADITVYNKKDELFARNICTYAEFDYTLK